MNRRSPRRPIALEPYELRAITDDRFRALVEFVKDVQFGQTPSLKNLQTIAAALRPLRKADFLDKHEFKVVVEKLLTDLGIRKPDGRGHPRHAGTSLYHFEIAVAVEVLMQRANLPRPNLALYEKVAEQFDKDERTLRRAYKKYRFEARSELAQIDEAMELLLRHQNGGPLDDDEIKYLQIAKIIIKQKNLGLK